MPHDRIPVETAEFLRKRGLPWKTIADYLPRPNGQTYQPDAIARAVYMARKK